MSPKRIIIQKSLRLDFLATNNEAKYEALLVGMAIVQKMGGKAVEIFSDSKLVVGQVQGKLEARDPRMQEYLSQVRHLQSGFESFNLSRIPRSRNTHANSLATLATSLAQSLPRVILVEDLCKPAKAEKNVVQVHQIRVSPNQMDSIVLFLKDNVLPENKSEVDKIRRKAPRFWLSEDQKLYKRSFLAHIYYTYTLKQLSYSQKNYIKGLWKSREGQIFVSQGPYLRLLVAKYVEGNARVYEEA